MGDTNNTKVSQAKLMVSKRVSVTERSPIIMLYAEASLSCPAQVGRAILRRFARLSFVIGAAV
jgi:hypothetical protein